MVETKRVSNYLSPNCVEKLATSTCWLLSGRTPNIIPPEGCVKPLVKGCLGAYIGNSTNLSPRFSIKGSRGYDLSLRRCSTLNQTMDVTLVIWHPN